MRANMESKNRNGRKRRTWSDISNRETQTLIKSYTLFPILLAALSNNSKFLIKSCLNKLLPPSQPALSIPILSLLPILLKSKCGAIVRRTAEVVGAASLSSLESNELIALDADIVKALISLLGNSNRRVWIATCNAVLDLSTTSLGRKRLLEFSALDHLLFVAHTVVNCNQVVDFVQDGLTSIRFGFLQVHKSSTMVSLYTGENDNITSLRIGFKEDELPVLHLDATMNLINACNIEQLKKIPKRLSECFLVFLKEQWIQVRNQMLCANIMRSTDEKLFCVSNITINNLAESIFRLSINANKLTTLSEHQMVKRSIFGSSEPTFENFMLNYWEISPFIVKRLSDSLIGENDIFSSYVQSLSSKESCNCFLSSILQCVISCLPIASDELDTISYLKEVRNKLGCPLIYEQDIRVLRTEKHSKREVHFFSGCLDSCSIKTPYFIYGDDILKCEEACKQGYTIALRGVEFRFESVAAIADGFASLFGQPSVGANMYLTPPNSQGLAHHYDDHCVFVYQLFGSKQWKVFSQPSVELPRLYSPRDIINDVEIENSKNECRQFSLREGDILYIPRGFLHEACTDNGGPSGSAGFSLHLTFGIEIEPPFEWEGFVHVALCCWNQAPKKHHDSAESLSGILKLMSVNLLHVVILLIGDSDPTFRKACLGAAVSLPLGTDNWLYLNQKTIFAHLIDKINAESTFLEVLSIVEMDIQENIDPFQRIRWLQFLDWKKEPFDVFNWNLPYMGVETMFSLYVQHKDVAEAAFMQVKSKFCSEILYEDVIENYLMLLDKYKKTRKQYMNGMLALHSN